MYFVYVKERLAKPVLVDDMTQGIKHRFVFFQIIRNEGLLNSSQTWDMFLTSWDCLQFDEGQRLFSSSMWMSPPNCPKSHGNVNRDHETSRAYPQC